MRDIHKQGAPIIIKKFKLCFKTYTLSRARQTLPVEGAGTGKPASPIYIPGAQNILKEMMMPDKNGRHDSKPTRE
jgi:hypothetical protein